jgi:hypothetical protein
MRPYKRTNSPGKDLLAEYDCTPVEYSWYFQMYTELRNKGFKPFGNTGCDCRACLVDQKRQRWRNFYNVPPWERARRAQIQAVASLIERRTLSSQWELRRYERWVPRGLRCLLSNHRPQSEVA